jgi:hypothetical protein
MRTGARDSWGHAYHTRRGVCSHLGSPDQVLRSTLDPAGSTGPGEEPDRPRYYVQCRPAPVAVGPSVKEEASRNPGGRILQRSRAMHFLLCQPHALLLGWNAYKAAGHPSAFDGPRRCADGRTDLDDLLGPCPGSKGDRLRCCSGKRCVLLMGGGCQCGLAASCGDCNITDWSASGSAVLPQAQLTFNWMSLAFALALALCQVVVELRDGSLERHRPWLTCRHRRWAPG